MVKEWLRWQLDDKVEALRWCFQLERTTMHPDLYNAYLQVEGKLQYYDIVQVASLEQSKQLRHAFDAADAADGGGGRQAYPNRRVRALCAYNRQFRKWYPVTVSCEAPVKNVTRRALFATSV